MGNSKELRALPSEAEDETGGRKILENMSVQEKKEFYETIKRNVENGARTFFGSHTEEWNHIF